MMRHSLAMCALLCLILVLVLQRGAPNVCAQDALPLSSVIFVGPGGDLGAFPITTMIRRVHIRLNGVEVEFSKRDGPDRWPDNTTPGWAGPLQYSLGMALRIGAPRFDNGGRIIPPGGGPPIDTDPGGGQAQGQWYASAPIETWYGANVIGGPIQEPGQIPHNWFYDTRWGPMMGYQPRVGETIGLFVVAGDPRNHYTPIRERSNIVFVTLPAPQTTASFSFAPMPSPTPDPQPPPPAPSDVETRLQQLEFSVTALHQRLHGVALRLEALEGRTIPMTCRAAIRLGVARIPVACTLE